MRPIDRAYWQTKTDHNTSIFPAPTNKNTTAVFFTIFAAEKNTQ